MQLREKGKEPLPFLKPAQQANSAVRKGDKIGKAWLALQVERKTEKNNQNETSYM